MKRQDKIWSKEGHSQRAHTASVVGKEKYRPVDRRDGEEGKLGPAWAARGLFVGRRKSGAGSSEGDNGWHAGGNALCPGLSGLAQEAVRVSFWCDCEGE